VLESISNGLDLLTSYDPTHYSKFLVVFAFGEELLMPRNFVKKQTMRFKSAVYTHKKHETVYEQLMEKLE